MKKWIDRNHPFSPPVRMIVFALIFGSATLFLTTPAKADEINAALVDCYSGTYTSFGEPDVGPKKDHNKVREGNKMTWYVIGPENITVTFTFVAKDECLGVSPFEDGINPLPPFTKTKKDYQIDKFVSKRIDKGKGGTVEPGLCYNYNFTCSNLAPQTEQTQSGTSDPIIDVPKH